MCPRNCVLADKCSSRVQMVDICVSALTNVYHQPRDISSQLFVLTSLHNPLQLCVLFYSFVGLFSGSSLYLIVIHAY